MEKEFIQDAGPEITKPYKEAIKALVREAEKIIPGEENHLFHFRMEEGFIISILVSKHKEDHEKL